jgi:hypothetical protein
MVLVDSSVWIDHLRHGNATLRRLLDDDLVACHPFVVGELACGTLHHRAELLARLEQLPMLSVLTHEEALTFLGATRLAGRALGWVDVHLLGSAVIERASIFTLDRRLSDAASALTARQR